MLPCAPMSQPPSGSPPVPFQRLEGPSYPVLVKAAALALAAGIVAQGLAPEVRAAAVGLPFGTQLLMAAAVGIVGVSLWSMLRSRTAIDATHIRQSWLWRKEVALTDIVQVKLIHLRGFEWLVVPRLVVRTRAMGVLSFPTADRRVLAAFEWFTRGGPPPAG